MKKEDLGRKITDDMSTWSFYRLLSEGYLASATKRKKGREKTQFSSKRGAKEDVQTKPCKEKIQKKKRARRSKSAGNSD